MTGDEVVGWHHWFNGHEFEQALGVGDGQGGLVCCSPCGRKQVDMTERLNWITIRLTNFKSFLSLFKKQFCAYIFWLFIQMEMYLYFKIWHYTFPDFSLSLGTWSTWHVQNFSLVTQLCPTLCDSVDCSMPGIPVHHQLPELAQTHVHWISDAIQPPHLLLSPSPPAFNLAQH